MSLPEVTEIRRWKLEPGDRLIVNVDAEITNAQVELIKERVRGGLALPGHVPVLVTSRGVNVEVVSERSIA